MASLNQRPQNAACSKAASCKKAQSIALVWNMTLSCPYPPFPLFILGHWGLLIEALSPFKH